MIELINLTKSFASHKVLDDLNYVVKEAKTTVIMGQSGCGKSVLLKHIVGLIKPDWGQVIVDGVDIARLSPKELDQFRLKFGVVFQGAARFDSLTIWENVGFTLLEQTDMDEKAIRARVKETLALVGLKGVEDQMPQELSGGMRKRVGIARAICTRPKIILYDEPTTGVDPITADSINDLIMDLRTKLNTTSIVVTHDMSSAFKVADEMAMLYKGKIIESGGVEAIKDTKNPIVNQFIHGTAVGPITATGEEDMIA